MGHGLGGGGLLAGLALRRRALGHTYGVPVALYTDWKNVYVRAATEKESNGWRPEGPPEFTPPRRGGLHHQGS